MSEEELEGVIKTCIYCGGGISKRSLNLLSSTLHTFVKENPAVLVESLKNTLCDFDAPIAPTRILLAMSQDLEKLSPEYFLPITEFIIDLESSNQSSSIIAAIHNSVFILPFKTFEADKAMEMASTLTSLLHTTLRSPNAFQTLATAVSQFMKKWALILPHPEIITMAILSILSDNSLTYPAISLLSQAAIYTILALIGDLSGLKDMIEDIVTHHASPLDQCTAVSNITFMDYVKQSIPQATQHQLLASFLFTIPAEYYSSLTNHSHLIYPCIVSAPEDEIGQTCLFQMLSAALKVMSKRSDPIFLAKCRDAIFSMEDAQDTFVRKSIKQCFVTMIQCAQRCVDSEKFFEEIFVRMRDLPVDCSLRLDCMQLIVAYVPNRFITVEFFNSILSLFDQHQSFVVRVVSEIAKTTTLTPGHSDCLFSAMEKMGLSVRQNFLTAILKASPEVIKTIREHATRSTAISDNHRLALLISISSLEQSLGKPKPVDLELINNALHSWNFELRLSALKLLAIANRSRVPFKEEEIDILEEAIPRVFVFCDVRYEKFLENVFQTVCGRLNFQDEYTLAHFVNPLLRTMTSQLRPHLSGFRKTYIVNCLKLIWRRSPLFFVNADLLDHLVSGLFESSYALRDLIFRTLLFILRTPEPADIAALAHTVVNASSKKVADLIDKNSKSNRFREADGAARLIALVNLAQGPNGLEDIVSRVWAQVYPRSTEIPPHFPLSVILHVLQSVQSTPSIFDFVTRKLIPALTEIVDQSLEALSVETNPEVIPVQAIKGGEAPESQLNENINKSWLAVRQAFNIFSTVLNRYFSNLSIEIIQSIGDVIFRFLLSSKHYSTVYHAHLTFQALCTLCFTRSECSEMPMGWTEKLLEQASQFNAAEHRSTGSFIQTALALIHSEPANLFASQRGIYNRMLTQSFWYIEQGAYINELVSGLLLCEAIAADPYTQPNIEPYAPRMLMSVFLLSSQPMPYSIRFIANRCLSTLLMRHWKRKTDDPRDFETMTHSDFFSSVNGALDFFVEHLLCDTPDVAYIILQVIQLLKPFPMDTLLAKIADMRSCKVARARRAAARALPIVLNSEAAIAFIRESLEELDCADANTSDGIVMQIEELIWKTPSLKEPLIEDVRALLNAAVERHETSYIKLYMLARLASLFSLESILKDVLKYFCANSSKIIMQPLGQAILMIAYRVASDIELVKMILQSVTATVKHIVRFLMLNPERLSKMVSRAVLDVFLRNPPAALFDVIAHLILKNQERFTPNEKQTELFMRLLDETTVETRLIPLLRMLPMFCDPADIMPRFASYGRFVDHSMSGILGVLADIMLRYHKKLFTGFDPDRCVQWILALRIVSDESVSVRQPCCEAVSQHLFRGQVSQTEFDIIRAIYQMMAPHTALLKSLAADMQNALEEDILSGKQKREPTPFLHPPSFHIDCIKKLLVHKK